MTSSGGYVFQGAHVLMATSGQGPGFGWFLHLALSVLSGLRRLMHGFALSPRPLSGALAALCWLHWDPCL